MIKVNFATTAPQFTKEDDNRRLFKTYAEKKEWIDSIFTNPEQDVQNPDMDTIRTATLKANFDNLESGRNTQYLYFVIDGFTYFYFVDSVIVVKANTDTNKYLLEFRLSLDTVTTYLDKIQFKGSTKVKRTHWDRFDKDGHITFDPNSAIWNNETSVDAKPSIKPTILPFNFKHNTDKIGVDEYFKHFNYTGNRMAVYGIYTGKLGQTRPAYTKKRNVPYVNFIAPLFSGYTPNTTGVQPFDYMGTTFNKSNSSFTFQVYASPSLQGFRTLALPIRKHWEGKSGDEFFAVDALTSEEKINVIEIMDGEYELEVQNPFYKKIDKTNALFNPENETKLYSSQYYKASLLSYTGERKPIINEFINNNEEKLQYDFMEDIISVEGVAHFTNNSYKDALTNYTDKKVDFIIRDELPSQSSPYLNFVTQHANAFRTGVETNRLKGGLGAVTGIAGGVLAGSSGNIMGAIGGIGGGLATAFMAGRQEKMYHAQIQDLKNTPGENKGINGSILSDWDVVATDRFTNSVINYGIVIEELSDIDKFNVAMYFNKYGYETEKIMHIKDISELQRRSRFTYWECDDIYNNIVKGSIPKEVLEDITEMFGNGLRLWEPKTEINNYLIENWEL